MEQNSYFFDNSKNRKNLENEQKILTQKPIASTSLEDIEEKEKHLVTKLLLIGTFNIFFSFPTFLLLFEQDKGSDKNECSGIVEFMEKCRYNYDFNFSKLENVKVPAYTVFIYCSYRIVYIIIYKLQKCCSKNSS